LAACSRPATIRRTAPIPNPTPMKKLLWATLLASSLPAQGLTAKVNDPDSHGTLADAKLSLDEAIRLANDDTFLNQLSAAERAQITGSGSLLARIVIDPAVVPVITLSAELTPVITVTHSHQDIAIDGLHGPNGHPVLDGKTFNACMRARTNHAHIDGIVFRGGKVGVDYDTSGHFHPGHPAHIHHCEFAGQSQAGVLVRVPGTRPGEQVPLEIEDTVIRGAPVGLQIDDNGQSGTLQMLIERVRIEDCKTGILASVTSTGFGFSTVETFRFAIVGADDGVRVTRATTSDSQFFIRFVHGEILAAKSALDVQGSTNADTVVHHHELLIRGGPGTTDYALHTHPASARFDLHGSENEIDGNVLIQANRNTRRIWHQNNRYRNGSFTIDNDGVPPEIEWNVFESVPVTVAAGNQTPLKLKQCELVRSPVAGNSTLGGLTLEGCFLASSPISGNVANNAPAPGRWIAAGAAVPSNPPLGGFVDLVLDQHQGTAGVWLLGLGVARPATTNYPFRFYLDLSTMLFLPGAFTNRSTLRLPVPADPAFKDLELYAQPVVVPVLGQTWIPPITLPIGGRIVIGG
jgi:hypothetical protein